MMTLAPTKRFYLPTALLVSWALAGPVGAADWPQWRGPQRDGVSRETGLLSEWPDDGPAELWRVQLGAGYSGVSVVGEKVYTMYGSEADEFVVCLDAKSGKTLWQTRSAELYEDDYGSGPRATPTVDGNRVYTLSRQGK